jgi:hypothetical protein
MMMAKKDITQEVPGSAVGTGSTTVVDKRPLRRKPVGAAILLVFLVLDWKFLHLLHDAFGKYGILISFVLFFLAIGWGWIRVKRLFRR